MFGLATEDMLRRFQLGGSEALRTALMKGCGSFRSTWRLLSHWISSRARGRRARTSGGRRMPCGKAGGYSSILECLTSRMAEGRSISLAGHGGRMVGPMLMHVAALAFHYGPKVATRSRRLHMVSRVWGHACDWAPSIWKSPSASCGFLKSCTSSDITFNRSIGKDDQGRQEHQRLVLQKLGGM